MGIVKDLVRRTAPMWLRHAVARRRMQLRKRRLFGALTPLVPEVADMFEGPGSYEEFKANGEEFLGIYQRVAGLTPNERFLDVGSGIGRKTIPLTQFLRSDAVYEGIDVNPAGIEWCRRKITPRFPNFRFQRIDVRNDLYNPTGTYEASEYRFPFPDESFTFVMLGSVFTHMLPRDVEHYLAEIHRVLAPGQRCLISYFLLNEESRRLIASNASTLAFHLDRDDYAPVNPARPEDAIALPEAFVKSTYERLGFKVTRIEYGSWCGRAQYLSYQDLVLAVKG